MNDRGARNAIDVLKEKIKPCLIKGDYWDKAVDLAIEALKKEIPQKPDDIFDSKYCPSCGYWVEPKYLYGEEVMEKAYKYCPECGQKLKYD